MKEYLNKIFETPQKASADIVAGGNIIWHVFHYELVLLSDYSAIIYKIISENNGIKKGSKTILFEGHYNSPRNGYYSFELKLNNNQISKYWCCQITEDEKLICHGYWWYNNSDEKHLETELFGINEK